MPQQDLSIRDKVDLLGDSGVVHPPGQALDAAFRLGAIGHLRDHFGSLRTAAADSATDQRDQGGQVPHHLACKRVRIALYQGAVYGTISAEVVAHCWLLLDWSLSAERVYDEPTS
jgi:hypothetical protein